MVLQALVPVGLLVRGATVVVAVEGRLPRLEVGVGLDTAAESVSTPRFSLLTRRTCNLRSPRRSS